jgi:DNA-binding NarL/FixJ family response regulator
MTHPPLNTRRTRVLLVDDHPIVRQGLADSVSREPDLEVCAEAEDRVGALAAIENGMPDLVIADLALKGSSGMDLIKDAHARWPQLPILVVSMHDEELYAERVLRAGARGFITKQHAARDILAAIRRVLSGQIYLDERMMSSVLARVVATQHTSTRSGVELLADRELQVFEYTGEGLSIKEIAQRLGIEAKTVETYRARIKEKLKLEDSGELLKAAIRWKRTDDL